MAESKDSRRSDMTKDGRIRRNLGGLLMALCGVIAVLVIAIVIVAIIQNNTTDEDTTEGDFYEDVSEIEKEEELEAGADELIGYMDELIENAKSNEEKADLYLERAADLYNMQMNEEGDFAEMILSDARKAEELFPTIQSALDLYTYESEFGNPDEANKYYNLAVERKYTESVEGRVEGEPDDE